MNAVKYATVDAYLASFPEATQRLLTSLRATIKRAAPQAEEAVSYGLAGYKHHGPLVYFGGFKNHIGFYGASGNLAEFDDELTGYKRSKGTVQFPLDKPLPLKLIERMVQYRVKENESKAALMKKRPANARK